uniref:Uncharacterized protein n=1 Tax=Timema shepardi TaxID=629360 RepID=A0A7R9G351_TIMSH|nr:unnamed protein product [Timema shepardi]
MLCAMAYCPVDRRADHSDVTQHYAHAVAHPPVRHHDHGGGDVLYYRSRVCLHSGRNKEQDFTLTSVIRALAAPVSMKSVLQSGWLLTVAFGNLVVIIIAEAKFFDSQANEFFLFAGLMLLDMALFCWMAMKYKYVETPEEDNAGANLPLEAPKSKSRNGSTSQPLNSEDKGRNGVENKSFNRDE